MSKSIKRLTIYIVVSIISILFIAPVSYAADPYTIVYSDVTMTGTQINTYTYSGVINPAPTDIIIPSNLNGQSVESIAGSAFSSKSLTSVSLPNTLTSIGANALSSNVLTSFVLPTPTKDGYTLDGWYDGITLHSAGSMVSNLAFSYTAQFSNNQYSVIFNGNGSTSGNTSTIIQDSFTQVILPNCGYTKIENTYLRWNTQSDGNGISYIPTESISLEASDIILYAIWDANQYTISFNEMGGNLRDNITDDYESQIISAPSVLRTGYDFLGWYEDILYSTAIVYPYTILENDIWFAKWEIIEYDAVFDGNTYDSGATDTITQDYNSQVTLPACGYVKTEYTFLEWNTQDDGLGTSYDIGDALNMPEGGITFYAIWRLNQYTILLDENDGDDIDDITQDSGTDITVSPTVTKLGNDFLGWYEEEDFQTKVTFPHTISQDDTWFAKWQVNKYKIIFWGNESTGGETITIEDDYNKSISLPDCGFEKTGHSFIGWNSKEDGLGDYYYPNQSFNILAGDIVLYAIWETERYSIYLVEMGGYDVNNLRKNYNDIIQSAPKITRENYIFVGWYKDSSYKNIISFPYIVTQEEIWYAKWTNNKRIVSFDINGGAGGYTSSIVQDKNTQVTLPECSYMNVGYKFSNWNTREDNLGFSYNPGDTLTMPEDGIVLYAIWIKSVSGVSMPQTKTISISETSTITAKISPSDADNRQLIWSSNNINIVTVNDGMILGVGVGKAIITVMTQDGEHEDTCIVQVVSEDKDKDVQKGTISGKLVDEEGNPIIGAIVTLYSAPKTIITGSTGAFAFQNVSYQSHTLVVEMEDGIEMGRYDLSFAKADNEGTKVNDNAIDVSYHSKTAAVEILLALNSDKNIVTITEVTLIDKNEEDDSYKELKLVLLIAAIVLIIAIILILIGIKRNNIYNEF